MFLNKILSDNDIDDLLEAQRQRLIANGILPAERNKRENTKWASNPGADCNSFPVQEVVLPTLIQPPPPAAAVRNELLNLPKDQLKAAAGLSDEQPASNSDEADKPKDDIAAKIREIIDRLRSEAADSTTPPIDPLDLARPQLSSYRARGLLDQKLIEKNHELSVLNSKSKVVSQERDVRKRELERLRVQKTKLKDSQAVQSVKLQHSMKAASTARSEVNSLIIQIKEVTEELNKLCSISSTKFTSATRGKMDEKHVLVSNGKLLQQIEAMKSRNAQLSTSKQQLEAQINEQKSRHNERLHRNLVCKEQRQVLMRTQGRRVRKQPSTPELPLLQIIKGSHSSV